MLLASPCFGFGFRFAQADLLGDKAFQGLKPAFPMDVVKVGQSFGFLLITQIRTEDIRPGQFRCAFGPLDPGINLLGVIIISCNQQW